MTLFLFGQKNLWDLILNWKACSLLKLGNDLEANWGITLASLDWSRVTCRRAVVVVLVVVVELHWRGTAGDPLTLLPPHPTDSECTNLTFNQRPRMGLTKERCQYCKGWKPLCELWSGIWWGAAAQVSIVTTSSTVASHSVTYVDHFASPPYHLFGNSTLNRFKHRHQNTVRCPQG